MKSDQLVECARLARERAYAPYSRYSVGASVLGLDGNVYSGCNVENASYGLTMCAERNAIGTMLASGCSKLSAVALVTANGAPPCGACLQVMIEFALDPSGCEILCADELGRIQSKTLAELLPTGFRL